MSQIKYFPLELRTCFIVLSSILKCFLVPGRQVPFLVRKGLGPQGPYSNYAYGYVAGTQNGITAIETKNMSTKYGFVYVLRFVKKNVLRFVTHITAS